MIHRDLDIDIAHYSDDPAPHNTYTQMAVEQRQLALKVAADSIQTQVAPDELPKKLVWYTIDEVYAAECAADIVSCAIVPEGSPIPKGAWGIVLDANAYETARDHAELNEDLV